LCTASVLLAQPFDQWRGGPQGQGVAEDTRVQPGNWSEKGPKLLWEIQDIPGDNKGGFSCVSLKDGKAVLFVNEKYRVPFEHRTITKETLKELGGVVLELDKDLAEKIEAVRTDKRVLQMERRGRNKHIDEWIGRNVPEEARKDHQRDIQNRIRSGADAISHESLKTLKELEDKRFENDQAIQAALKDRGFDEKQIEKIRKAIATYDEKAWDWIYCWDADSGKEIWKKKYVGKARTWPTASTPALKYDRVYVAGSEGQMYCLDLNDGREIWKVSLPTSGGINSSPLVHKDRVYIQCHGLTALDARSGDQLWRVGEISGADASPVLWTHEGRDYIIAHGSDKLQCVQADNGKLLWSVEGGHGPSTPCVQGDIAVLQTNNRGVNLGAWKLTPETATLLWRKEGPVDRGASPVIYNGHVYTLSKQQGLCVELDTGRVAWDQKIRTGQFSSPIVADGKLLAFMRNELQVLDASPSGYNVVGEARIKPLRCTSPVVVGSRLYMRTKDSVACYDLASAAEDTQ
jgi:outer membrane protein assembly factor BamB